MALCWVWKYENVGGSAVGAAGHGLQLSLPFDTATDTR